MHVGILIDCVLPAPKYGGTERMVIWLGAALIDLGHQVTFFCREGSNVGFAPCIAINREKPLAAQIPKHIDIVHAHSGFPYELDRPACQTIHDNSYAPRTFHQNTVFVSENHAERHGGKVWVHHGMDPQNYAEPDFLARRERLAFLAKAAWRVKNVTGAIKVARLCHRPLDVLGGSRVNFRMGFRITFDPHVKFHGMVDDALKSRHLRTALGLLFPVRWHEPFGLAVIEAMYFGVPIFGTPYGALPELVKPHLGHLSADGQELAAAASDTSRYDNRAIHEHWKENYSSRIMALRYLKIFERILDGEMLHDAPIEAPPTRDRQLLPWTA